MVYAMRWIRGDFAAFGTGHYDFETVAPWADEIRGILEKRQPDACADWKALGEKISGKEIEDFDLDKYQTEYLAADEEKKDESFLGAFFLAAMAQKSMVTNKIFRSGNLLAGYSVDFAEKGFRGIRDYRKLLARRKEENT